MNTLDAPVYEVKQDSEWYKDTVAYRERQKAFFKEMNEKYSMDSKFVYWQSEFFGIVGGTPAYELYKDELRKNAEDGVYPFKKRSKYFPIFKEMIEKVGDRSPFKSHDVLGMNNMTTSQWIGARWFYGVKDAEQVKGDEVEPINYKDYLKVVMDAIDKQELKG